MLLVLLWPMRRIVTVVVAAIPLLREMTIPRMKKEILFTGHFEARIYLTMQKARLGGPFFSLLTPKSSGPE